MLWNYWIHPGCFITNLSSSVQGWKQGSSTHLTLINFCSLPQSHTWSSVNIIDQPTRLATHKRYTFWELVAWSMMWLTKRCAHWRYSSHWHPYASKIRGTWLCCQASVLFHIRTNKTSFRSRKSTNKSRSRQDWAEPLASSKTSRSSRPCSASRFP